VENLRVVASGGANATGNTLNNLIYAGAGNNAMNGGNGVDTLSYLYASQGVTLNLGITTTQATVGSGSDTVLNLEHLSGSIRVTDNQVVLNKVGARKGDAAFEVNGIVRYGKDQPLEPRRRFTASNLAIDKDRLATFPSGRHGWKNPGDTVWPGFADFRTIGRP
jgi:hypothetical protein